MYKSPSVIQHPSGLPPTVAPHPNSGVVTPPNLLNSDSSEVTVALTQTVPAFVSICTELQRRGAPSLLHSDNSVDVLP
ncbi:hypothetical protein Acr_22g0005360 [Actinidia rufa]|uniref:Uncharacterized protein n=1 Tax=Actinidia rufa TaxID=165716 RepID=A0A7J0GK69_9ERIC|nr:hypothetical protein Acr_22g0005360 [Actinidia rufa]